MRLLLLLIGMGMSMPFIQGQRASKVHSHKVQYFRHTPRFYNGEGKMYFVGNPNRRGNQLFQYNGEEIKQLTHFPESYYDTDAKQKERNPVALGANIQSVTPFGKRVLFFAKGEEGYVNPGLYLKDQGFQVHIKCADVGDILVWKNMAYAAVTEFHPKKKKKHPDLPAEGIVTVYQMDSDGKVLNKLRITSATQVQKLFIQGQSLMALLNGQIIQLVSDLESGKLAAEKINLGSFTISDVYTIGTIPYFVAQKNSEPELGLYRYGDNELEFISRTIPNKDLVHPVQTFSTPDELYFAAHTAKEGTELYRFDGTNPPILVSDFSPGSASTTFTGIAAHQGQVYFSAKRDEDASAHLYQANKEGIIENDPRYMRNIQHLHIFDDRLYFYAYEGSLFTMYSSEPSVPPYMPNFAFTLREFSGYGTSVGYVKGEDPNKRRLKYSITSGNTDGAFAIDVYTGEITVSNSDALSTAKNPTFELTVTCKNRKRLTSAGTVSITLEKTARFSQYNLQEKLLFFPDFKRPGLLKSLNVPNGTEVKVFNFDFALVDVVRVTNGYIQLGKYPPGYYVLNITNGSNLYQKIEMQ